MGFVADFFNPKKKRTSIPGAIQSAITQTGPFSATGGTKEPSGAVDELTRRRRGRTRTLLSGGGALGQGGAVKTLLGG